MGDKTGIEWTDATWNPVTGCDRVSPGCDNCYAMTLAKRLKAMGNVRYQVDGDPATSGPGFGLTCHPDLLDVPLRWKRPRMIFVNSMSDLFHPDVLNGPMIHGFPFLAHVVAVMVAAKQHTFQVLTKRPQLMRAVLSVPQFRLDVNAILLGRGVSVMPGGMSDPGFVWPGNIWWGTSIESDRYTFRADHLRATPAATRFISAEPLLGSLPSLDLTDIDWLIVGGESGPGARPMHPDWVRDLRDAAQATACQACGGEGVIGVERSHSGGDVAEMAVQCQCRGEQPGTALFFKQWGSWTPHVDPYRQTRFVTIDGGSHPPDGSGIGNLKPVLMSHGSKGENGRELDGRTWDEYPWR